MPFRMTEMVGCDFPLFAFSHCRDVVAAVSRAGGFGVIGAVSYTPEQLEHELAWIDDHVDGKPYGVDVLIPEVQAVDKGVTADEIIANIPAKYRDFTRSILREAGIGEDTAEPQGGSQRPNTSLGQELLEVSFNHPVRLIANALGTAPPEMIAAGKKHGIPVAALVGAKEHAMKQIDAGVDIIVAQGGEGGGHCGDVATVVLIPEVLQAIEDAGADIPVLAAGGIMNGRQMAGMMAMGAAGVWCGSVWLATTEAETHEVFREKMVAATSRDTVRSKYRTGKYSRQLRSGWHARWEEAGLPALPMPLMSVLSEPVLRALDKAAVNGNRQAQELCSYWVGQGVGLVREVTSSGQVVQQFKEDFLAGYENLSQAFE
ncbi:NAD(P)H-dependent flavin oxidoreductase YrpB, nitropropane dioxygenase family [Altererythrobacter xiamenensis]|uniref:NAD(P)H-dependent flavin oxidoreductase YrpB, nitropropane dioxygenase family n=1 Tax=Altererythrobacter xiamenensis TaxID=1316679 RepID=A0A1Y6F463_9SPHN|nr:nitronate monooxygenase [Altererythrobacter xiamenensis]SMQ69738.1 NAD(P)H-dependent flavin oxidoreductase YrpB, nitropropane dioxygenase family [Altererythrobacter xiamenensis]